MKKSLTILFIILVMTGHKASARNGIKSGDNAGKSEISGSLKRTKQSLPGIQREVLTASISYSTFTINGNSPSSRKNSHWLVGMEEELAPMAPDEIGLYAERSSRAGTIEKIHRIRKEKEIERERIVETKIWYEAMRDDAYVEIFVSGGGFRGGVNPVVHDQVMISNSGFIQSYYETEISGVTEHKKAVNREELMQFAKWIAENGFFEMEREYNCGDADALCNGRIQQQPAPIPLKVVVALGPYRNVVTVPIFSPERQDDYIDYPDNLKKIVKAIYDFASL